MGRGDGNHVGVYRKITIYRHEASPDALQIRPHHVGHAADFGAVPNVICRCLLAGAGIFQRLQCHVQADFVALQDTTANSKLQSEGQRMGKQKQAKRYQVTKPDELFTKGPIRFERHGRFIVGRNNWTSDEHSRFMNGLADQYDAVVAEIDALVTEAAAEVARYDPLQILHRAWWMLSDIRIDIEAENQVGKEDVLATRMVDYVQSLIASTQPSSPKEELCDEGWAKLKNLIGQIFDRINNGYFLSSTAKLRQSTAPLNQAYEEFVYLAQLHWCNVTGKQYQNHQIAALRELLGPQTQIVEAMYGLSSAQLCDELERIWHSLTFGIRDAFDAMQQFREKLTVALDADGITEIAVNQDPGIVSTAVERHGLQELGERAAEMWMGLDMFDLQKVCTARLPAQFLEDFSWSPGQDAEFFGSDGDFKGWPLRIWPTFKRPFLKVDGRHYCFDGSMLFDHFYRQLEKQAFKVGESVKQRWIEGRKRISESLPFDYLHRLLPGSHSLREVYYHLDESGKKKRYEADGLLMYDGHLFIVEVKSGAFTYTSPATDAPSHVQSLRNLVSDPAKQGQRVLRYLRESSVARFYDEVGNEKAALRLSDYRHVTLCAITLDPFTEMAARIQHLHAVGVEVGDEPIWALSIDDLRVYADLFTNPLEFLHFVEQRRNAFRSPVLQLDDELDHLGMYLKHNHYRKHAEELVKSDHRPHLQFVGYREEIDKFFSNRLRQAESPPLHQRMPSEMLQILRYLADCGLPGRSTMACFLLDMAGDVRDGLFKALAAELIKPDAAPCRPYSTHGDVRLTAIASSPMRPMPPTQLAAARRHAQVLVVLHEEPDRTFLHVVYTADSKIESIEWAQLKVTDIDVANQQSLRIEAEEVRLTRLAKAGIKGIGRNDQCPCGSGRKYKKCCLSR